MRQTSALIFLGLLVHVYSAPQFISFKDGKLGVNFGGYHAGVGIGGGAGNGAAGGLFAEAGTPHGQAARAGLGGSVDGNGNSRGGLFAGATAGGNVKASTGLAGGVTSDKAAGAGFAVAGAGGHEAASGLGGESSVSGSSGFEFSGTKSHGIPTTVIKEAEVSVVPVEHKVHTEFKLDAANEIQHTETDSRSGAPHIGVNNAHSTVVEDDYEPPKTVVQKTIIHTHYKPKHHHHHEDAYIGGYIGGEAQSPSVQKRVDIGVQSSANAGFEGSTHVGSDVGTGGQVTYKKEVAIANPNFFRDIFNIPISTLKAVSGLLSNTAANTGIKVEKSAVIHEGGNAQSSGYGQIGGHFGGSNQYGQGSGSSGHGFKVEKYISGGVSGDSGNYGHGGAGGQIGGFGNFGQSAQIGGGFGSYGPASSYGHFEKSFQGGVGLGHQKESDINLKHAPHSQLSSSSDAQITVQTPSVSNFFDNIFAIPINTLGAVNKFLENNVQGRKRIQVTQEASGSVAEPTRVRLGPHARRRANKHVVILQDTPKEQEESN